MVEDDYIEPNDFRDPGNRKQKRSDSQEGLKNKSKKDPYSVNGSQNPNNKYIGSKKGSLSQAEGSKSRTNDEPSVSIGLGSNEIKNPASNSKSGGSKQGSMSPVGTKKSIGMNSFDKRN